MLLFRPAIVCGSHGCPARYPPAGDAHEAPAGELAWEASRELGTGAVAAGWEYRRVVERGRWETQYYCPRHRAPEGR